jgi:hypothetical protein
MTQPQLGAYGDVCSMSAECSTMLCSKNPWATADHECTGPCKAMSDCMLGDLCVMGGVNQCAQSDIGRSCAQAQDCRAGACVVGGNGAPSYCTVLCSGSAQCPAGFSCSPISNTKVCVDVDSTPPCVSDAHCYGGTLCDVANQRCLGICGGNADCPLQHKCTNVGGRLLCAPNLALGRGGIGDPCNTGDDCRGGACLGTTCVGSCGVTAAKGQWCPGGWGCNPADAGNGTNVLVCVPAGSGSPGDPCASSSDCASGLCISQPGYCSRFCNDAPCPSIIPHCTAAGVKADGVSLLACTK